MYLVRRLVFHADGRPRDHDTGARLPLRLFADRADAERHCRELTAAARRATNPFLVCDWEATEAVRAELARLDLPLPWPDHEENYGDAWAEWWDLCQDELTDEQRAALWDLFGVRPLFEVAEVELED